MSLFQQPCPECHSVLELPSEADGKAAVCPACKTQFTAQAGLKPDGAQGNSAGTDSTAVTHSPANSQGKNEGISTVGFQQVSIETVFGDAQTIYTDRRTPLLLPFLIPMAIAVVGVVLPLAHLSNLAIVNLRSSVTWTVVLSPLFLVVISYMLWFALNLSRDVCDAGPPDGDTAVPKSSWFIPSPRAFLAVLIAVLVVLLTVGFLATACYSIVRIATKVKATEIMILISFVGITVIGMGGITAATRLWPIIPLAIRGHWGVGAFQYSLAMTKKNLMTSFLTVTTVCFMLGVGFSLFGIGLPFAIPITMLLMTVTCRSIEGKEIPALSREF